MSITVNIRYTGINGNARRFAKEMTESGTVADNLHMKVERFVPEPRK